MYAKVTLDAMDWDEGATNETAHPCVTESLLLSKPPGRAAQLEEVFVWVRNKLMYLTSEIWGLFVTTK